MALIAILGRFPKTSFGLPTPAVNDKERSLQLSRIAACMTQYTFRVSRSAAEHKTLGNLQAASFF
jgi:hypothetical protein